MEHSFLMCDWTRIVWLGTQIQCIPRREQITRMNLWLLQKLEESQGLGENRCFFQISLVCTLWTIWNERNQAFHHRRDPNPWASLHMANLIINDYYGHWNKQNQGARSQTFARQSSRNWRLTPIGVIKLNIDASFNRDNY